MPTADHKSGNRSASSTFRRLVATSVPMVTTRSSPAAAARATTSARSAANRSSSRCAWVSITGRSAVGGRPRAEDDHEDHDVEQDEGRPQDGGHDAQNVPDPGEGLALAVHRPGLDLLQIPLAHYPGDDAEDEADHQAEDPEDQDHDPAVGLDPAAGRGIVVVVELVGHGGLTWGLLAGDHGGDEHDVQHNEHDLDQEQGGGHDPQDVPDLGEGLALLVHQAALDQVEVALAEEPGEDAED